MLGLALAGRGYTRVSGITSRVIWMETVTKQLPLESTVVWLFAEETPVKADAGSASSNNMTRVMAIFRICAHLLVMV